MKGARKIIRNNWLPHRGKKSKTPYRGHISDPRLHKETVAYLRAERIAKNKDEVDNSPEALERAATKYHAEQMRRRKFGMMYGRKPY